MQQSISQLFELYLSRCDIAESTEGLKRQAFKHFIKWFGDIPVGEFNEAICEDYRTLLKKGRSIRSTNTYWNSFKPFGSWLVRRGRLDKDPFAEIRPIKEPKKIRRSFDLADVGRMVRFSDCRMRVLIGLGLCGCRRGEALNMTIRDINLDGYAVISSKDSTEETWKWQTKDSEERIIPLPKTMALPGTELQLHREIILLMERVDIPYLCLKKQHYLNVLQNQTYVNQRCPYSNFPRVWRQFQKRVGVAEPRRYHDLRGAFCTAMIRVANIDTARELAGHANIQTTSGYNQFDKQSLVMSANESLRNCYNSP